MTEEPNIRLAALRNELDAIDLRLLESIRDRIDVCSRVARVKSEFDIPMMQPGRVDVVQQRALEFGRAHGVSEDFLRSVYTLLISEACRVENVIIDADSTAGRS